MAHLWLRAEQMKSELRTPLTPAHAKILLNNGHHVTVEQTTQRIIPTQAYQEVGCNIVPAGTWEQAPKDAYILGLKKLPDSSTPLIHKHIYFAHAFKGQQHAEKLLQRFVQGEGALLDLEYLLDEKNKRVAAFGFYAGIVGAALSVKLWCHKMLGEQQPYTITYPCSSFLHLVEQTRSLIAEVNRKPAVLVIGAQGRCGSGARYFLGEVGLQPRLWGRNDMKRATMSHEMLSHDVMLNCIYVDETTSPFLTKQDFVFNQTLSVIGDISCEPDHECNPLPFYTKATSFDNPALRIWEKNQTVDLISIDNLPTLLPLESSMHFSEQLLPHLKKLLTHGVTQDTWHKANEKFKEIAAAYFKPPMRKVI